MKNSIIKDHNPNFPQKTNSCPKKPHHHDSITTTSTITTNATTTTTTSTTHSHSPSFLFHNGFNSAELEISDIEMITLQSVTYTSLKDLLPPATISNVHNSSWIEVPIRNPLVKHAALAYLQPMSTPHDDVGDRGFFGKLKRCGFGCFEWLSDVVFRTLRDVFGKDDNWNNAGCVGDEYCEEDEDEEEDEEEEE